MHMLYVIAYTCLQFFNSFVHVRMLRAARCRPQLCVTIIYLSVMRFDKADEIAIFSFVMSIFSLLFNIGLGYKEVRALAEDGNTPRFV